MLRMMPDHLEIQEVDFHGSTLYQVVTHYQIDLSSQRKLIQGASLIALKYHIDTMGLKSVESGKPFTMAEDVADKLDNSILIVEFPDDIQAKKDVHEKAAGRHVHDSLYRAFEQMNKMKSHDMHYPPELEQ